MFIRNLKDIAEKNKKDEEYRINKMFIEQYGSKIKNALELGANKGKNYTNFYIDNSFFDQLHLECNFNHPINKYKNVCSEIISYWIESDPDLRGLEFKIEEVHYETFLIKFIF